jgi:hypothetical protein
VDGRGERLGELERDCSLEPFTPAKRRMSTAPTDSSALASKVGFTPSPVKVYARNETLPFGRVRSAVR